MRQNSSSGMPQPFKVDTILHGFALQCYVTFIFTTCRLYNVSGFECTVQIIIIRLICFYCWRKKNCPHSIPKNMAACKTANILKKLGVKG